MRGFEVFPMDFSLTFQPLNFLSRYKTVVTNIINHEFPVLVQLNDGTKSGVDKEEKFRMSVLGILYTIFVEPFKHKEKIFTGESSNAST